MSFHLTGFTLLIGNVADTDVPGIQDDVLPQIGANRHVQLPTDRQLLAHYVSSATLTRVRLDSPTLRFVQQMQLRPVELTTLPIADPSMGMYFDDPPNLRAGEEISMLGTSAVAMTERFTGLLWLAENLTPRPVGDKIVGRFTSTTAAVVNAWTSIALTLDAALPPGRYSMVGSEVFSTNAIAHRWIFPNQIERPGGLSAVLGTNRTHRIFYESMLGEYGQFINTALPILQVLCNVADAVHTGFWQLIRIM